MERKRRAPPTWKNVATTMNIIAVIISAMKRTVVKHIVQGFTNQMRTVYRDVQRRDHCKGTVTISQNVQMVNVRMISVAEKIARTGQERVQQKRKNTPTEDICISKATARNLNKSVV